MSLLLAGCGALSRDHDGAPIVIHKRLPCPPDALNVDECREWPVRPYESFELNVDAERDRINGQEAYGCVMQLVRAHQKARATCEGDDQEE